MTSGQHLASNAKLHFARLTGGSWKKSPHKSNLQRDWTGMYVGHKYEYVSRQGETNYVSLRMYNIPRTHCIPPKLALQFRTLCATKLSLSRNCPGIIDTSSTTKMS